MVSDAVSRNRFSAILSNIHFANNNSLDYSDKFAKVRPLLDHVVNTGPRSGTGQSSTSVSTWLSKTHSNSIVNRRESLKSRRTTCCHSAERLFRSTCRNTLLRPALQQCFHLLVSLLSIVSSRRFALTTLHTG